MTDSAITKLEKLLTAGMMLDERDPVEWLQREANTQADALAKRGRDGCIHTCCNRDLWDCRWSLPTMIWSDASQDSSSAGLGVYIEVYIAGEWFELLSSSATASRGSMLRLEAEALLLALFLIASPVDRM